MRGKKDFLSWGFVDSLDILPLSSSFFLFLLLILLILLFWGHHLALEEKRFKVTMKRAYSFLSTHDSFFHGLDGPKEMEWWLFGLLFDIGLF